MKKRWIILILVVIIIIWAISFSLFNEKEEPVYCAQDAKMCPDGSYVARIPPDCEFEKCPVSKNCIRTEDCVVFGESGDCNCGCYHYDALPQTTGGNCFCAAPVSCECVNGICEGVF